MNVNRDLTLIHPACAEPLVDALTELNSRGLQFGIWEGYRSPDRQRYLYSKGRWGPFASRRIVTSAKSWRGT